MKKLLLLLFVGVFLVSFVSAELNGFQGYKVQGSNVSVYQVCNCTFNNITNIIHNETIILQNQIMNRSGTYFNFTLHSNYTQTNGIYTVNGIGDLDGVSQPWSFTFEINPTGIESSESRSTAISRGIYILFAISLILFIGFLFIKQKTPVKWTLFLLSIMFFLPAMNILFVEMQDQVVNPNIENFFSFFTAVSFYMFWFAFGLLAVMWFLTLLQTLIMRNKIAKGLKYG